MRRVLSIMVLAILIFQITTIGYAAIKPENGIAYVLLPKDLTGIDGVYRLNNYVDPSYDPLLSGNAIRLFDLNFGGAVVVNGLAVNQDGRIYLFVGPNVTGVYTPVDEVGWLPSGQFEADSPAFIKLIGQPFDASQVSQDVSESYLKNLQYPFGTTNYDNDFWDYGPSFTTHGLYIKGSFTDAKGNPYSYYFNPIKPDSHKNTPLWNGPGASSAGIHHPTDPNKVILPNKWGGISWYAFGSPNAPAADVGKLADGKDGRPLITNYDFQLVDHNAICSPYSTAKYISTVVKRVYEKRDRSLDLYAYMDNIVRTGAAPYTYPSLESANVLTATDLKITEQYGKTCADGCIPGGALNPEAIGKIESCVQVFTSTTGNRYGFNPFGKKTGPYGANDAALRVVHAGSSYNLDLNSTNIKNAAYFTGFLGKTLDEATALGVSSNFQTPVTPITKSPDYLYASIASKFCIQDSWWGHGGLAFEYYAKDTPTSGMNFLKGHIYRLDYMTSDTPTPEDVGFFDGDVDAISVDGQGNLYILTTELDCPNSPPWPDENGLPLGPTLTAVDPTTTSNPIKSNSDYLGVSDWMRPSTDGTGDTVIPSPSQAGDYIKVRFKQYVKKVCRKYTPSAGGGFSASSVEDRGYVNAGFDPIVRNMKYNSGGTFSWVNDWYHEYGVGSRAANIDAEFAVVNIAAKPVVENTDPKYSICRVDNATINAVADPNKDIEEDTSVTFKIEGYRPIGPDGKILDLLPIADIPSLGGKIYLNLIPPYSIDEDGDGSKGGFESSMFESSAHKTTVTWHVDMIESADTYNCDSVLNSTLPDTPEATGAPNAPLGEVEKQKRYTYTFTQPGNYAVYADIAYNCLDYDHLDEGDRPDKLRYIPKSITTKKVIYHVLPKGGNNKVTDGYITNIKLKNANAAIVEGLPDSNAVGNGYFMKEDTSPSKLSFSFDAKFVKDANALNSDTYKTYDGVGVWDYGEAKHVYNYDSSYPNKFNPAIFNPGRQKFASGSKNILVDRYMYGTRVDIDPRPKDLKEIKWKLYIYPTFTGATFSLTDEGILYAKGNCEHADCTETVAGSRIYNISVNVASDTLANIATPIDPKGYKLRLEIEYPRVGWNEDTNGGLFRSIIPGKNKDGYISPRGYISSVEHTIPPTGVAYDTKSDSAFSGPDYWMLNVRDSTVIAPYFNGIVINGVLTQIATYTTGDPIDDCIISMTCSDNNPISTYPKKEMYMLYDIPNYPRDTSHMNTASAAVTDCGTYGPIASSPEFFLSNDYVISASYNFDIKDYGKESKFAPGKSFQNWIGELRFSLDATLHDGYDVIANPIRDGTHRFCKDATDARLITDECSIVRYDNDPPSFTVELMSQADNRRWKITLSEGLKDFTKPGVLANSILTVKCYKLDGSMVLSPAPVNIEGSSNYPTIIGNPDVMISSLTGLSADFVSALPRVRRSSRLQITVRIDDNVDYQNLKAAEISVTEGAKKLLASTSLDLTCAYKANSTPNPSLKDPRGRFFVDMPMTVSAGQALPATSQVKINLTATDSSGNRRTLIIPVEIVDSTFDARVLESKENRN